MKLLNFTPQSGQHCETTTIRNMLAHEGAHLSEAMLFGLGEGLDFQHWVSQQPTAIPPILSGRVEPGRITHNLSKHLELDFNETVTESPSVALKHIESILNDGHVPGLKVDIYYLDYFTSNRHFAAHYLSLYGLEKERAYVVDTCQQGGANQLPIESLSHARDSQKGFMPSRNLSIHLASLSDLSLQFSEGVISSQTTQVLTQAIKNVATNLLQERGPLCGIQGLHTTAKEISNWHQHFDNPQESVASVGNFLRFAGTGGANFRLIYKAFLSECIDYLDCSIIKNSDSIFELIVAQWDSTIDHLLAFSNSGIEADLMKASQSFYEVANLEHEAMLQLINVENTPTRVAVSPIKDEKTICRMCHGGCGAIVTMENGIPKAIRGDSSNPISEGYFCAKGKASIELVNHPDRLMFPQKRVVKNGLVTFERISWEEALDEIATKVSQMKAQSGSKAISFAQGTDRNYQEWVFRLANAIGTPNVVGPAHVCFYPRVMSSILTFGGFTFSDYDGQPNTVLVWGSNKLQTHSDGVIGIKLAKAMKQGAQLIVVDPYETIAAKQAEIWLQIKPGTDGALALAMMKLIIEEKWFDEEFVSDYTLGFEELADKLANHDINELAEETGLLVADIYRATRLYSSSLRATIETGTGVSQNSNSFDTLRSIYMLSALCGFLDKEGGDVIWEPMDVDGRRSFPRADLLPEENAGDRLGSDQHRILAMSGWATADALWRSILTAEPYKTECLIVFGSNLLTSYANQKDVHKALEELGFLVVCDMFMTPTAQMADIILPVSSWLERDQVVEFNAYIAPRRKLAQVAECKSDEEIILALAERLEVSEHFWPTLGQALDHKLVNLSLDWASFSDKGVMLNSKKYRKYEQGGFATKSGKVNLFHHGLKQMGYSALPEYQQVDVTPQMVNAYPYILTSAHSRYFYNSEYHQLQSLAKHQEHALISMHVDAAKAEGLFQGDTVKVYTPENLDGVIFSVNLTKKVAKNVVYVDACWWYPNQTSIEQALCSSVNALTHGGTVNGQMGSNNLRGFRVALSKVEQTLPQSELNGSLASVNTI
ncbi:molybdopterin-dependent oxidoreductase [Shewanella woodyi]|uniref:molybdopterin-dependent oxidoreductase n=1 Tax=Shewanella woodyi TaxID=60961 RepID=UPI0007EB8E6C|nr:molybdopterin-dependent oxidoreductase [Shewanella woodyi]